MNARDIISGKVAIVTGGSRGIGKEIAKKLAGSGANVVITSRNQETLDATVNEFRKNNRNILGIQGDVSNSESVFRVLAETEKHFGPVDILVNNAGIGGQGGHFWTNNYDTWWKTIEINLKGPMLYTHAVLKNMISRKKGIIINIGSYAGIRAVPMNSSYATSKAALIRFTDSIAASVREFGINMFTVSPGLVDTDMTKNIPVFKNLPASAWTSINKISELVLNLIIKDVSKLSGRFIHVEYDLGLLINKADSIIKDGLYTLRLAGLDGLIE